MAGILGLEEDPETAQDKVSCFAPMNAIVSSPLFSLCVSVQVCNSWITQPMFRPSKCWPDGTGFRRTDPCSNPRNTPGRGMELNHPELRLDPDIARRVNQVQTPKKKNVAYVSYESKFAVSHKYMTNQMVDTSLPSKWYVPFNIMNKTISSIKKLSKVTKEQHTRLNEHLK